MSAEVILLVESAAFKKTLQNYHKNLHNVNNSYYNLESPSGQTPWLQALSNCSDTTSHVPKELISSTDKTRKVRRELAKVTQMDYSKLCGRTKPIHFRSHLMYGICSTAMQQSYEKHLMFVKYFAQSKVWRREKDLLI